MTDKELFLKSAKDEGIKTDNYSITKLTDYSQVSRFLNRLKKYKVSLGLDMSSLTCSGDVEIACVEKEHICLIENDNGSNDYFKFKSLLILNSELNNPESSPEMFFEAATDVDWLIKYEKEGYPYLDITEGIFWGLNIEDEGKIIYDKESIDKYLDLEEESYYNSEIIVPKIRRIVRNTKKGMIAYVNLQECSKRHSGDSIIYRARNFTCDDLLRGFSKHYKILE